MISIGFKDTEVLSKSEVALTQLNDAISLFVNEHFISSLTLAGAADGVLSGLLQAKGEKCEAEVSVELFKTFREVLDLDPEIDHKPKAEFFREWNQDRNRVKHHNKNESSTISINSSDAAYWMLRRALSNAKRLGLQVSLKSKFENWLVENVHL